MNSTATTVSFTRSGAAQAPDMPADKPLADGGLSTPTLCDLLEDGIYLFFLMKDGNAPASCAEFNRRVDRFLANFDKQAKNFGKAAGEIEEAKYAFCALLDEIMLSSGFSIRDEWARMPLQLRLFEEHLAGEGFFAHLESLRVEPDRHIEALEVFHTCLLLGFQGKYLISGLEKLDALIYRVGKEIRQVRGEAPEFAPRWKPPQRFQNYMRHEMPMWLFFGLMALAAVGLFVVLRVMLDDQFARLFGG
ncbi:MAG: type IVB secretion system protein IcmH/DotU [Azoarcus sp.]|jgi:type VI secretion system protein ImpK|nr:type IVB secretion system protein IcmH/DotU [Azoarcus sp.]